MTEKSGFLHSYADTLAPLHFFGPRLRGDVCRFSFWCRTADSLDLLLFDSNRDLRPVREVRLNPDEHRFGDVWSVDVSGVKAGMCYVWRIYRDGDSRFPDDQYVLDPWAPAVAGAPEWGQSLIQRPGDPLHTGPAFPKAVVVDSRFDWAGDSPPKIPWADMVIYEVHARGFTADPKSGVKHPGTYAGLIEKIPHLKALGVTSVELMPVFSFDEMEYYHAQDRRSELRNYWGYSTLSFFAPNARYAAGGHRGQQVDEFKALVKALHKAGMEVILDVVYNHTAEGGPDGPNFNFRIVDDEVFYIQDKVHGYHNYSGCGNTFNCNHPVVRGFILDSLRHWVTEYHVDGFRFDLATILARDVDGRLLSRPPLIEAIDEDPILRGTKMIAEAWDAAGGYQVGTFCSPLWSEWNGKYRDEVRRFWAGEPGMLSLFATRVLGSEDLYSHQKMGPLKSINFVNCHDGFTLRDLVSYRGKHNEANMEENRDGENTNHSENWGEEGETDDPDILALRLQMQKNFLATLLLSRGIPMFPMGDEWGRTQKGNNNGYCQDNELGWMNWDPDADGRALLEFTQKLIALRKSLPVLRVEHFPNAAPPEIVAERVKWYGSDELEPDWAHDQAVGLRLSGLKRHRDFKKDEEDVLILFNASSEAVRFHMPDTEYCKWKMRLYTTAKRVHRGHLGSSILTQPHSMVIFSAKNTAPPPPKEKT